MHAQTGQLGRELGVRRHGPRRIDVEGEALDHELLKRERLVRLREAVLVGRPPEALEVMDVVDDWDAAGEELERDRGQGVREVVAVDEVGAKLPAGGSQALDRLRAEVPPALE